MNDLLVIRDLELWTRIGVPAEERKAQQRVLVTIELSVDVREAAKTDDVSKSINYQDLVLDLQELATGERKTIERLAEDCAGLILSRYQPASVTVQVTKFPPLGTREVAVRVCRGGV